MAALVPPVRRAGVAARRTPAPAAQRAPGVQAKSTLAPAVQAKLTLGRPDDTFELEADRAADRVMRAMRESASRAPSASSAGARVQRAVVPAEVKVESTEEERPKVQAKRKEAEIRRAGGGVASSLPSGFDATVSRMQQSSGSALPPGTLAAMEHGFGVPLGDVRVHADGAAASAARAIDARAFTVGRDVFFGAGEYQPHSPSGQRLIAHELTHTVQQTGGMAARSVVQRQPATTESTAPVTTSPPPPATGAGTPPVEGEAAPAQTEDPLVFVPKNSRLGRIEKREAEGKVGTLYLPVLRIPFLRDAPKGAANHPHIPGVAAEQRHGIVSGQTWTYLGGTERDTETARQSWLRTARANAPLVDGLEEKIGKKVDATRNHAAVERGGEDVHYLRLRGASSPFILVGTRTELARHDLVLMPSWNRSGDLHFFDVDHIHELQLGGLDGWDNFWLLDQSANRSSGSKIHSTLESQVRGLLEAADRVAFWVAGRGGNNPTFDGVRASWRIVFDGIAQLPISDSNLAFWTRQDIEKGDQLQPLVVMTECEVAAQGLVEGVRPRLIAIFTSLEGGFVRRLTMRNGVPQLPRERDAFYRGFDLTAIEYEALTPVQDGRPFGVLRGVAFRKVSRDGRIFVPERVALPLVQSTVFGLGGYLDQAPLRAALANLQFIQLSPIAVDEAAISIDGALVLRGRILAARKLFPRLEIPFAVVGDHLTVDFPVPADRLKLGPVTVTEAALRLFAGERGLGLGGMLGFAVEGVGSGRVEAGLGAGRPGGARGPAAGGRGGAAGPSREATDPFALHGVFNFDADILDPARIEVAYVNDELSLSATLGLREGAVPGVQSAQVTVASGPDGVAVAGTAVLGIAGLEGVTLTVSRDARGLLTIAAEDVPLPLGAIPGVQSAMATIRVQHDSATGEWVLSGAGSAQIDIANVQGRLAITVEGPLVTFEGGVGIRTERLQAAGHVVVTNRPRDPEGNPIESEPGPFTVSGRATAEVTFGIIRGGATVIFGPGNRWKLSGTVSLPPVVTLFPEIPFERPLFEFKPISIPLPIPVGGVKITGGGGVKLKARIGPGLLLGGGLSADYDPEHPEAASITGQAQFLATAFAGLRIEGKGGLSAGLVLEGEALLVIGAEFGVAGTGKGDVFVSWTPLQGLRVGASADIAGHPQFTFDASLEVRVYLDLLLGEVDLYGPERFGLAKATFGSGLAFGACLPIAWSEQDGLEFDITKVEPRYPDISLYDVLSSVFDYLID